MPGHRPLPPSIRRTVRLSPVLGTPFPHGRHLWTGPDHFAVQGRSARRRLPPGEGELVLVVHGSHASREAEMQRLEVIGYAVIDASTGEDALRQIEEGEPVDLVYADCVLPGAMSGPELAVEVFRRFPGVGLMLAAACGHPIPGAETLPLGVEMVQLPLTLNALAAAVRRALDRIHD